MKETGMYRLFFVILFCLPGVAVITTAHARTHDPVNVFVSILPQKYLVERVGGERVIVNVMVRPGLNPETYEPTPKQMAELSNADLYFRMAVPFESVWIKRISSINPEIRIIECCGDLAINDPVTHEHEFHAGLVNDAHIWTSPQNAIVLAEIIKSALSEFDPEYADHFENNYRTLVSELNDLDQHIEAELAGINNRYLIVAHPSWGHFAEAYGLQQISIEQHGMEIKARQLSKLVEFARKENIHTIYTQKQFNNASAKILAREINSRIVELDPLAEDYINNLRHVTQAIIAGAQPQ
jgi:zinc transport system substrate-binding protein